MKKKVKKVIPSDEDSPSEAEEPTPKRRRPIKDLSDQSEDGDDVRDDDEEEEEIIPQVNTESEAEFSASDQDENSDEFS